MQILFIVLSDHFYLQHNWLALFYTFFIAIILNYLAIYSGIDFLQHNLI